MNLTIPKNPVDIRHKLPPLRALTPLRFFAAVHVVLLHEIAGASHLVLPPFAMRLVNSGYTAVTLFFVLSGFILAYNYERIGSRTQFWMARFARVYPVYLLSLLFPFVSPHWSHHPRPGAVGTGLTFFLLQAWWPPLSFSLNLAAWTLSVEAFFYALFPFLLPWVMRVGRNVFFGIQAAYLAVLCLPPLLAHFSASAHGALPMATLLESTVPLVRLNAFVLGMYSGVHFRRGAVLRAQRGMAVPRHGVLLSAVFVATFALLVLDPQDLTKPLRTGALQLCYACLFPLMANVRWRVLDSHMLQMAGEISYGMYILQFPVIFVFDDAVGRLRPTAHHSTAMYLVVLIAAAYVSFRWFEVPARIAIRQLFSGRPVPLRPV